MRREPDYYAGNGLSPIGAFKQGLISTDEYRGFLIGNIIKYVIRAGKKDDAIKDLRKAKDYINFYMDLFTMTSEEQKELDEELIQLGRVIDWDGDFPEGPTFPPVNLEYQNPDPEKVKEYVEKAFKGLHKTKEVDVK